MTHLFVIMFPAHPGTKIFYSHGGKNNKPSWMRPTNPETARIYRVHSFSRRPSLEETRLRCVNPPMEYHSHAFLKLLDVHQDLRFNVHEKNTYLQIKFRHYWSVTQQQARFFIMRVQPVRQEMESDLQICYKTPVHLHHLSEADKELVWMWLWASKEKHPSDSTSTCLYLFYFKWWRIQGRRKKKRCKIETTESQRFSEREHKVKTRGLTWYLDLGTEVT